MKQQQLTGKLASLSEKTVLVPPVRLYGDVRITGKTTIGKYTYVGHDSKISGPITIGNYCSFSRNVEISPFDHPLDFMSTHPFQYSTNHFGSFDDYETYQRVKGPQKPSTLIGHDVWIGAKAFIRAGVTIGTGSVIAAGAVIVNDVLPYTVVGGVPGRPIRMRFDDETIQRLLESRWWELEPRDMQGIPFNDIQQVLELIPQRRHESIDKNRMHLRQALTNEVSGTAKGFVWVSAPNGGVDQKALDSFKKIKIIKVQNEPFKSKKPTLKKGTYDITDYIYDAVRRAYRINIGDENGIYNGTLGKGAVTFQLLPG